MRLDKLSSASNQKPDIATEHSEDQLTINKRICLAVISGLSVFWKLGDKRRFKCLRVLMIALYRCLNIRKGFMLAQNFPHANE